MFIFEKLKKTQLRVRAPLTVILFVILAVGGSVLLSYAAQKKALLETKRALLSDIVEKIESDIAQTAMLAESRSVMLATIPEIVEAFRKEDRKSMIEQLKPMFLNQKQKYFMSELQFHKPPASTFLKLHKDGDYGEDLSGFRKTVVLTNKEKNPQRGMELGRAGLGIRGVVPILDTKGHIGSLEIVFTLKNIINKIRELTSSEIGVFIDKNLFEKTCTQLSVKSDKNQNSAETKANTIGEFYYLDSSNKEKILSVINKDNLQKNSELNIIFPIINGAEEGIAFAPLLDFAGKTIGKITIVKSFQDLNLAFSKKILWEIINSIVQIIVIASAVFVAFNGLLLFPLAELIKRSRALALGEKISLKDYAHYHNELDKIADILIKEYPEFIDDKANRYILKDNNSSNPSNIDSGSSDAAILSSLMP
ncbi:MAG: hypothetical protein K2W94_06245 [Alphaproteobacteria bacterium]|nr:hypothetical protein [Alphaproteobacteria bacterium]